MCYEISQRYRSKGADTFIVFLLRTENIKFDITVEMPLTFIMDNESFFVVLDVFFLNLKFFN